jgi:hypothetical protein
MEINNPWYKPFSSKTKKQAKEKDPYALHNVTDEEKLKDLYDQQKEDM